MNKKKRNKPYTGQDAQRTKPTITRVTAVVRSPMGEWWADHKKQVRYITVATVVVAVVAYLLFELIRLLI